jgi:hypothetical protein
MRGCGRTFGTVAALDDAVAAFNPTGPVEGTAIISVRR